MTLILAHYESRINTSAAQFVGLDLATSGKEGIGPFIGLYVVYTCFGITHAFVQGDVCGELSFMCLKFIQRMAYMCAPLRPTVISLIKYRSLCLKKICTAPWKCIEQNALSNLFALCLLSGIFAGVALSWLWQIGKSSQC